MAGETLEIAAAGQPKKRVASQAKKRKTDDPPVDAATPRTPSAATITTAEEAVTSTAKKTACRGKKRKTDDSDSAAGAPLPKKTKKEPAKPATRPRQPKRTKKIAAPVSPPSPLQPLPLPAEVTAPVQAKVDAVKRFRDAEMAHEDSMLERDPKNAKLVSIPELDLVGVVMTLHYHYQLPAAATEASLADIEDAITARFAKPVRASGVDVEWVTLDLSKPTTLEQRIKDKIANHGLEDVSLLELEMELCARRNAVAVYKWEAEKIMQTGDFLNKLVEVGWYGMRGKVERQLMGGERKEKGRRGVCPEPAVEIL